MRRRISLYIDDALADLSDDNIILFNWTQEDLTNPTAVKNSYSQQVKLPGTAVNDAIFGNMGRADRLTAAGEFSPAERTPFKIFDDLGEVLESGYLRLDTIEQKAGGHSYKVTLYGGLGGFLYSLAYNPDGTPRTLADMDYLGTGTPDTELDFNINRDTVKQYWTDLQGIDASDAVTQPWEVIQFAPMYNGIPDSDFEPGKAVIYPGDIGLPTTDSDGKTTQPGGLALATLPRSCTEWEVKDLRSYMQRPVFRMRALFDALARSTGRAINVSPGIAASPVFQDTWVTLPMFKSMPIPSGGGDVEVQDTTGTMHPLLVPSGFPTIINTSPRIPEGTATTATVKVDVSITNFTSALVSSYSRLYLAADTPSDPGHPQLSTAIFIQAIGVDFRNDIVAGSKIIVLHGGLESLADILANTGFVPAWDHSPVYEMQYGTFDYASGSGSSSVFDFVPQGPDIELSLTGENVMDVRLAVTFASSIPGGAPDCATLATSEGEPGDTVNFFTFQDAAIAIDGDNSSSSYTVLPGVRSGSPVTKKMLLGNMGSPADLLLSYCKRFGIHILCDRATGEISFMTRNEFYNTGRATIDITDKVDTSKDVSTVPLAYDKRWYKFSDNGGGTEFEETYKTKTGRDYGAQLVNTGYDFNADTKELIDKNVFREAPQANERSNTNYEVTWQGVDYPSVMLLGAGTYDLYDTDTDEAAERPFPAPDSRAQSTPLNSSFPGYALMDMAQAHDAENKGTDGTGILLILDNVGVSAPSLDHVTITDDLGMMLMLGGGKACWILGDYRHNPGYKVNGILPHFSRYDMYGSTVQLSMDFGTPTIIPVPQISISESTSVYSRHWGAYLADKFDKDGRVMTCSVLLEGLEPGPELFRRFYYYRGAYWVLNKISNYSLTTPGQVNCEFVKVKDITAYTIGQNF